MLKVEQPPPSPTIQDNRSLREMEELLKKGDHPKPRQGRFA